MMFLLGKIAMGRDSFDGKRSLSKSNTVEGILLNEDSEILEISGNLLLKPDAEYCDIQITMMRNIMGTFVKK